MDAGREQLVGALILALFLFGALEMLDLRGPELGPKGCGPFC